MCPKGGNDNSDDPKSAKDGVKYSPFTVDARESGVQEMPTISSLLNRKKTLIQKPGQGSRSFSQPIAAPKKRGAPTATDVPALETITEQPQAKQPTLASASPKAPLDEISLKFETHDAVVERVERNEPLPGDSRDSGSSVEVAAAVKVQPSRRTKRTNTQPNQQLLVWSQAELEGSQDPIAHFILESLRKGAAQGLFLSIEIPEGAKAPEFSATAYFGNPELVSVWTGLRWNPRITPDLWRTLIKDGIVEFQPPGPGTAATSERNLTRNALGAGADSFLLIVRVGPAKSCRGLLAIVSPVSLSDVAMANQAGIFASLRPSPTQKAA